MTLIRVGRILLTQWVTPQTTNLIEWGWDFVVLLVRVLRGHGYRKLLELVHKFHLPFANSFDSTDSFGLQSVPQHYPCCEANEKVGH